MHTKATYQKSRQKPAVVYWIHFPDQHDPYCDGYVGISTQLEQRLEAHRRKFKHYIKNASIDILQTCNSLTEAAEIEKRYRPHPFIGWNIIAGGDIPPSQEGRSYTRQKLKGTDRTAGQQRASKIHKERMKGRLAHNKDKGKPVSIPNHFGNMVEYSNIKEAAKAHGVTISTIYSWVYAGKAFIPQFHGNVGSSTVDD